MDEINRLESQGESSATELREDAMVDEKQELEDTEQMPKPLQPKPKAATQENPFEDLGESDEEDDEDEDEENVGDEGWDGEKFSGNHYFNEGLLADNMHHDARKEIEDSDKART